ncbi:MAG TPA: hypothetical protein VK212_11260 [Lentimicrobium sp.]|nr:hypothetical protein [Lentimicrobium sp.]
MKKIITVIQLILLIFPIKCISQNIDSTEMRINLLNFLISKGDYDSSMINSGTYLIIKDLKTLEDYQKQEFGIFSFGTLTSHSYRHLLLKDQNKIFLVNMRLPIEDVLKKLLQFFRENQYYLKEDILDYIEKVINLHQFNEKTQAWQLETH